MNNIVQVDISTLPGYLADSLQIHISSNPYKYDEIILKILIDVITFCKNKPLKIDKSFIAINFIKQFMNDMKSIDVFATYNTNILMIPFMWASLQRTRSISRMCKDGFMLKNIKTILITLMKLNLEINLRIISQMINLMMNI